MLKNTYNKFINSVIEVDLKITDAKLSSPNKNMHAHIILADS
jgi:hypothetical protein